MSDLWARFPELLAAHLWLSLGALAIATAISLPLGILAERSPAARRVVLGSVGVLQTIPSLALLAFMVPLIGALAPAVESVIGIRPSAIGFGPALAALTLYAMLPILQNTVTGLAGVGANYLEAAKGVGMTPRQSLFMVELPLAAPVILAGLRTAAVWTVGTAVLATPIGGSSLGDYIFVGLQTRNHAAVAVGCVGSAALALALDGWARALERAVERRKRKRAAGLLVGLLAGAIALSAPSWGTGTADAKVGAKAFTEGYVMAEVARAKLEDAGLSTELLGSLGSSVAFDALVSGDIDMNLDYSGTILSMVMKEELSGRGRQEALERVRSWLKETHDIRVAAVLGFENTYAFAIEKTRAEQLGVQTLSELKPHAPQLDLVGSYELFDRPEWKSIQAAYHFDFAATRTMEHALAYEALAQGEVDLLVAYSTDARVKGYGLVLLEDDAGAIPPYDAILLVRGAFADAHPEAMKALGTLEGAFDGAAARELNFAVDEEGRSAAAVAREWASAHAP